MKKKAITARPSATRARVAYQANRVYLLDGQRVNNLNNNIDRSGRVVVQPGLTTKLDPDGAQVWSF